MPEPSRSAAVETVDRPPAEDPVPGHLVITVHGIRTYGNWQSDLRNLLKQAEPIIKDIAKSEGVTLILDAREVIWFDPAMDLTRVLNGPADRDMRLSVRAANGKKFARIEPQSTLRSVVIFASFWMPPMSKRSVSPSLSPSVVAMPSSTLIASASSSRH